MNPTVVDLVDRGMWWEPIDPDTWYDKPWDEMSEYEALVHEIAEVAVGHDPYYYQRHPSLRIHEPGYFGIPEHADWFFNGHTPEEVNVWMPLTLTTDPCHWLKLEDVGGIPIQFGQALVFEGRIKHSKTENITEHTFISMDFRFIRQADYKHSEKSTFITGQQMTLGDYWK